MREINQAKLFSYNKHQAHGATVVEFALLLIPLLMIVTGVIEFGRTLWYYDVLTKATRDAARYVSSVSVDKVGSAAQASTTPSSCSAYKLAANRIVYCAAVEADVPEFSISDVNVLCDGVECVDNVKPAYITVSIDNYPVPIGGWIPVFLPTGSTTWAAKLSPETTMRYMH